MAKSAKKSSKKGGDKKGKSKAERKAWREERKARKEARRKRRQERRSKRRSKSKKGKKGKKGGNKVTRLHKLAAKGSVHRLQRFLGENKDVQINEARGRNGWTPLHYAASNGRVAMVSRLIELKADVNAKAANNSATPLFLAAAKGRLAVVDELLDNKATVNAALTGEAPKGGKKGKKGRKGGVRFPGATPLFAATRNGYLSVVKLLLKKGADPNASVKSGKFEGFTPLAWALLKDETEIADALEKKSGGDKAVEAAGEMAFAVPDESSESSALSDDDFGTFESPVNAAPAESASGSDDEGSDEDEGSDDESEDESEDDDDSDSDSDSGSDSS